MVTDTSDVVPSFVTAAEVALVPLRRNRDYLLLLAGQGISTLGDAVTFTALPLLVLALTGSGFQMGVVAMLQALPDFLFGLPAGAIADRWDRRRLMLLSDLGRALLTACIPVAALLGLPTMGVVLLVVAPINLLRVLWMAGWTAAVPSLVGRPQIGPAQSIFEVAFSLAFVGGPALAGLLVGVIGPAATIGIDAVSFLASVAALTLMRHPLGSTARTSRRHVLADVHEGLAFLARHRLLRTAVAFWALISLVQASFTPAVAYYVVRDRGLPNSDLGLLLSAWGLGALVGALVAIRLTNRPLGPLMLLGNAVEAMLLLALAIGVDVPVMVLATLGIGISSEIVAIAYLTVRATATPNELLGRIGSTTRMLSIGLQPLGLLATGVLLDAVHGANTLLVLGSVMLAGTILFALPATLRSHDRAA